MKTGAKARPHVVALLHMKMRLPVVLLACSLFFLAGFYGSLLFAQDLNEETSLGVHMVEPKDKEPSTVAMPYGGTGDPDLSLIPFQVLSWKPRALYFPHFASIQQCDSVMNIAKSRLRPSSLALRRGETEETTKGIRTSSGTFIAATEDPSGTLGQIEEKISKVTMIPRNHGEAFNVLRYDIGQRYASHYDSFHPDQYGPQESQRIASFLLYLSSVEEGGETMFPYENGANMNNGYDYNDCIGLKITPRKGDGLLFYSVMTNGTIDPTSLHGSCPVVKGEKWVATKWLRDKSQI